MNRKNNTKFHVTGTKLKLKYGFIKFYIQQDNKE